MNQHEGIKQQADMINCLSLSNEMFGSALIFSLTPDNV